MYYFLELTSKSASLELGLKNKERNKVVLMGFHLSWKRCRRQKCVFVFFLLTPGTLVPSYVWDKRCLFSLFHSCSVRTDERA